VLRHRRAGLLTSVGAVAASLIIAGTASAAPTGRTQLLNSKSPAAATTAQTSQASATTPMDFEVDLALPNQGAAEAFSQAVSTPGNALYQQFLTPSQWEARFAPSQASVDQVTSFLTQNGFTVEDVSADRMAVEATGTVQQVEQTFGTTLSYHTVAGSSLLLAGQNLSVPSGIAGVLAGVSGVNDIKAAPDDTTGGPADTPGTAATGTPATTTGTPTATTGTPAAATAAGTDAPQPAGFRVAPPCGGYYGQILDTVLPPYSPSLGYEANPPWAVCGYTGPQLRSAYNLGSSDSGAGQTVAVVDPYLSPTLYSDAARLAATTDPSNPLQPSQYSVVQAKKFTRGGNGVNGCGASGWYGEQTLDVEAVHDIAPAANIVVAAAKNCLGGLNTMLRRIIDHHLADVISNSYGDDGGDLLDSADDRAATDNILMMAAATGVTVTFSSGDDGDEYTTVGQVAADYPASSPWATAVGGTTLQVGAADPRTGEAGQRTAEYGWSTANSFLCTPDYLTAGGCTKKQLGQWLPIDLALDGGSGGGTSVSYTQPFYQAGVVPTALSEVNVSTPMRVEPDISMEADPATGMRVGETQTFPDGTYYDTYRIGGTSVASPLFAGLIARADQAAGGPLGFVNPLLYALPGRGAGSGALYDVQPTHQDMSRADYIDSVDSTQGFEYQTRIIDYEGIEQFCATKKLCSQGTVALHTAPGYDNMTGLGSPGLNFVAALSGH
jgi:subtilase family serine protease